MAELLQISTTKTAPVPDVKKNLSEEIAKESKAVTQCLVVTQLVNHNASYFLQPLHWWTTDLQVSA
jgi:hypothetical protein